MVCESQAKFWKYRTHVRIKLQFSNLHKLPTFFEQRNITLFKKNLICDIQIIDLVGLYIYLLYDIIKLKFANNISKVKRTEYLHVLLVLIYFDCYTYVTLVEIWTLQRFEKAYVKIKLYNIR